MGSWFIPLLRISLASWLFVRGEFHTSENGGSISDRKIVNESKICNTNECRQVANAFVEAMNKSVDPCDDFYEFVCGKWESVNPHPKYEFKWTSDKRFTLLAETRLRDELKSGLSSEDILPIQHMKQLYKSCMDKEARESEGLQKISTILQQAKGWPMIMNSDTWNSQAITWQEVDHYYEHLMGLYAFFTVDTLDYPSEPIKLEFQRSYAPLKQTTDKFDRNYTRDGIIVYRSVIKNIARLFIQHNKENISDEQLYKDIDDLLKFEETIPKRNYSFYRYVIASNITEWIDYRNGNLTFSTPRGRIDWEKILQNLYNITKLPMTNNTWFIIHDVEYFTKLEALLDSTEQRVIVNYIHWNFLSKVLPYTTDEANDILFKIHENEFGVQGRLPGWLECVRQIEEEHAAAYLFARKYYPTKFNAAVDRMTRNLKKSFEFQVNNSNWLSIEAKKAAINKLNHLHVFFGHSKWYNNDTALIKYYENLRVGTSYFENIIQFKKHGWLQLICRWGKSPERGEVWNLNVLKVNGRFSNIHNTILVPAATLQSPLFDEALPEYIRYGTVGTVIGHEIGHGFDYTGIQFGADIFKMLFTDDVSEMYRKQVECFVKAFDRYFENDGGNLITKNDGSQSSRGSLTLDENLADWSGIQAVFHAYKEIKDKIHNRELKLPGLEEFTDEQMLFISYAHELCTAKGSKIYQTIAMRNVHSPGKIRVIGTLSNTLEFSDAFNCPKNSPMNPEKKCNIWTNSSVAP